MTATATVSIFSPIITVKALDSGISYTGSAPVPVSLAGDVSGTASAGIINTTLAAINATPGTYVAQIAGGLCADIVQLKAENAMLRAENNQLKQEKQTQEKANG